MRVSKRQTKERETSIRIVPLLGLPEIEQGYDLAELIIQAVIKQRLKINVSDVFVVAQKIVSKAEGRTIRLDMIDPSERARRWAREHKKGPQLTEVVLREAVRIVRMERGVIIAETPHGFICANAGVDESNAPRGTAVLLPEDPDKSAREIRLQLFRAFGVQVGVIISDTFGRPWREGLANVALGVAGISPLIDYRGRRDASGKVLHATRIALADELASAAELVMRKSDGIPVAVIQGLHIAKRTGSGRDLIRPAEKDLFR